MKAIVYNEYGPADVLHLAEVAKPAPKDNEVLIKIHASTVTAGDCNARGFTFVPPGFGFLARLMFGLRRPKQPILGTELAGTIEAVGKTVTRFQKGDQVWGTLRERSGAYAEYICLPENARLVKKSVDITFDEAASVPFGGTSALYFLRDVAKLQPGQKILIIGASGGTGVYAVQLAKYYGAEVTGVCSTPRLEFVKSLGADKVIDYTKEDFTQNGETYDLIFDILGRSSFSKLKRSLKPNGIYLLASFKTKALFQMLWTSLTGSNQKVICAFANETPESLTFVKNLVEEGKIKTIIDKSFPMEQAAEAHRYVEQGRKQGNVVIAIQG
jgi:NADPH:quinone reductase-like Zn-dependent oxidoreductase